MGTCNVDLLISYQPDLLRYLRRMLDNHADAEDALQDTMVRCIKTKTYDDSRPIKPWLFAVARSAARKLKRMKWHPILSEPPTNDAREFDTAELVRDMLGRVPEECRLVLEMHFLSGLSCAQTAAEMGIPIGTVKSRMFRGIRLMRQAIAGLVPCVSVVSANADIAKKTPYTASDPPG